MDVFPNPHRSSDFYCVFSIGSPALRIDDDATDGRATRFGDGAKDHAKYAS